MQKRMMAFLLILCMLMTGCSQPQNQSLEEIKPKDMLGKYLSNLNILESPVREYGEDIGFIQLDEELMIRILYPEVELTDLNNKILDWVENTVAYYQVEAKGSSESGDSAELTAEYQSYLVGNDIVSIEIKGIFDKPYNAHPLDVITTFHASLKTNKLLVLEDILCSNGKELLQKKVIKEMEIDTQNVDNALLDNWILKHDSLQIILERGKYLPMSEGTVILEYSFDELVGIIKDSFIKKLQHGSKENTESELIENDITIPSSTIDPTKPMIALTFDDGPSKHTERLLDILAQYDVKGTFFVVGNLIENRQETLHRMVEDGHEIGGHSWDHRQLTKLSSEDITNQIMNTRAKIYSITGMDSTILRPPYGSYNDEIKCICAENGIVMVNWSVDTLDWKTRDADMIYEAIMNEVKDGDIILCHDLYTSTVDAMEQVIPALIERGYQLVTVSELLSYGEYEIKPGTIHNKQ